LFGICLLLLLARLPAGDVLSSQGWDLLALAGSGKAGFTLAAAVAA
jgi:protoheme IX farnesyltransferase